MVQMLLLFRGQISDFIFVDGLNRDRGFEVRQHGYLFLNTDDGSKWIFEPTYKSMIDAETFDKMYQESQKVSFCGATAQVVSVFHMILLKIHALKTYQPHRFAQDYEDVLSLLKQPNTSLDIGKLIGE